MRGWVLVMLLAVSLSGCATGDNGSGNPNLLAPKLLIAVRAPANPPAAAPPHSPNDAECAHTRTAG